MNQQRIIMSNLLILMIVAMAFMRAYEWVVRSSAKLEQLSDIYATMSHVIDINSAGWLLLIASVTLGASIFVGGRGGQALLLIGGLGVGSIMIMYSMIASANALLFATSYTVGTIGIASLLIAAMGGIALWNSRKKKE